MNRLLPKIFVLLAGCSLLAAEEYSAAFKRDCADAKSEDLPALIERFSQFEARGYKGDAFLDLSEAWLRLQPLPDKIPFPPAESKLPALPSDFPAELSAAIGRYLEVAAPYQRLLETKSAAGPGIDFQTHEQDYWNLLVEMLAGKSGPFTDRVLAYQWGGFCGTGSERFRVPQSRAILIALLRDGRSPEAVGAALAIEPEGEVDGALRVLSPSVSDLEKVVAGGLALQGLQTGHIFDRPTAGLLGLMIVLPGDDRVRLLTELATRAPPQSLPQYYRVLGKFVPRYVPRTPPHPKEEIRTVAFGFGFGWGGDNLDSLEAGAVGDAGQKLARDFLCSQASPSLPVEAGNCLAMIFRQKRQPQMIPALRRLLDHPSSTVADQAATALKEAGEVFTMPAKAGPARYRITVDGEPYANRRVAWAFVAGSSLGSEVTTSPDGIAELSRDTFLEVKNIQRLALRSTEMPDPSQPWFGALLPPPPSSAEPLPVGIRTQSQKITLDLPRSDADLAGQTMEVTLWGGQDAENQKIGFWSPAKFSLPASRELVLAKIQPGMYRMEVRIPGFTTSIGPLRAGKSGNVAIPFRRASDVKFTALLPPGWHPNFLLPELRQGGTRVDSDWDHEKLLFRGVPEGGYTLHIPSSAEVRKRVIGLLPDGPEFAGVEVPFEVKADSPTRLDLGEIRLK